MANLRQVRQEFMDTVHKLKSYQEALGLLYWDMRTGAPKKGIELRSKTIGMLSSEHFALSTSDQMGEYLGRLSEQDIYSSLDHVEQRCVTECRKDYERSRKIPPQRYREFVELSSQSESVWEEAKEKADFSMFQPYLEKIVDFTTEFIHYWGYEGNKYNTLLDMYEPGMTVDKLDQVFGPLREHTVPLVAEIAESGKATNNDFVYQEYDKAKQRRMSDFMLKQIGFDFAAGRLDESVHPFATGLNLGDVRVTTMYRTHDLSSSLFSSLHEGGHALYEQNISPRLAGTILCDGTSMGIHESQSRTWENMIGRSRAFWEKYYSDLQQGFSGQLDSVSLDQFYRGINQVKPSLIRIDADELTYNLHILIRYELENALINGKLQVKDLPSAWNEKYQKYLNVTPSHDGEGVLQDVHWSDGSFGYFPSYSLGNMYAAQIMQKLQRDISVDECLRQGNLTVIKDWLAERIYQYGKLLTPNEIIEQVTGEALNPEYLMQYLDQKYRDIYDLPTSAQA